MNTALLALILAPFTLALIFGALTLASYRADPPSTRRRGESRRQQELLDRAVELRGEVPDEFWPHVAPAPTPDRSQETAAVR